MYTGNIQVVTTGLDGAKDEVKPPVGIILIQARLEIRRCSGSGEIDCAPLNVKDAIGRGARYRGIDTARSSRETGTARLRISAKV